MARISMMGILLVTSVALSGCDKAPEEMTCSDSDVQQNARKLLAMKVEDWQKPVSRTQSMSDGYMKNSQPELTASLNGLRARSMSPGGIRFKDVQQISAPQTPLLDADPEPKGFVPEIWKKKSTGNKLLYQCAAQAHVKLPAELMKDLPSNSKNALGVDAEGLNASVIYQTELTPDGKLWVAASFGNSLVEMSLRALMSPRAEEDAQK